MKKLFPQEDKKYIQPNRGNVAGNIWSSLALDTQSNLGVLRVSPRLKLNVATASLANLSLPIAFKYFDTVMWTIAGTRIFSNGSNLSTTQFSEDASTGFQTTYAAESDLEIAGGSLVATTAGSLYKKAVNGSGTGAWSLVGALAVSSQNHKMTYFKKFDRLYILDNSSYVASAASALTSVVLANGSADYTIQLANPGGDKYYTTCIKSNSSSVWIGTQALTSDDLAGRGSIMQWDGISQQVTAEYKLEAHGCIALIIDDDIPFGMDTNGALLQFTGSTFEEVGRLPIDKKLLLNAGQTKNGQFIDCNGLALTKNNTILALVNGVHEDGTQNEQFPSGVYEFDKKGGCIHKYPLSYNPISSSVITDFGQQQVSFTGALADISGLNFSSSGNVGTILAGAKYYTDASTTTFGIFIDDLNDTVQKKGYVVSTWFESDELADSWETWWMSYRKFLASTDNITVKYRIVEESPVEATITWVNTTSFTVLNSAVDVSQYWTSATGGEVEILRGTGGSLCAHITNAVNNAGTWTVTIDEVATGVTTGTAVARFQKWIKIFPSESLASPRNWAQFGIKTESTPRIQMKICFTFTGNGEYYKGVITSSEDIKIGN